MDRLNVMISELKKSKANLPKQPTKHQNAQIKQICSQFNVHQIRLMETILNNPSKIRHSGFDLDLIAAKKGYPDHNTYQTHSNSQIVRSRHGNAVSSISSGNAVPTSLDTFAKCSARTLKQLIHFLQRPSDRQTRKYLEEHLLDDINVHNETYKNTPSPDASKPVQAQLDILNKMPNYQKQWARRILSDITLLENTTFIGSMLSTLHPNRQKMLNYNNDHKQSRTKSKHKMRVIQHPKPRPPTPRTPKSRHNPSKLIKSRSHRPSNPTGSSSIVTFKCEEWNVLIKLLQQKQANVSEMSKKKIIIDTKLSTLRDLAQTMPSIDTTTHIRESHKLTQQLKSDKSLIRVIIKLINILRKQENKLLKCEHKKSLECILEDIYKQKHQQRMKDKRKLQQIEKEQQDVDGKLLNLMNDILNCGVDELQLLKHKKDMIVSTKNKTANNLRQIQDFSDGIRAILDEIQMNSNDNMTEFKVYKEGNRLILYFKEQQKILRDLRVTQRSEDYTNLATNTQIYHTTEFMERLKMVIGAVRKFEKHVLNKSCEDVLGGMLGATIKDKDNLKLKLKELQDEQKMLDDDEIVEYQSLENKKSGLKGKVQMMDEHINMLRRIINDLKGKNRANQRISGNKRNMSEIGNSKDNHLDPKRQK